MASMQSALKDACSGSVRASGTRRQEATPPRGWQVRFYFGAFITPEDLAEAKAIEESGSLDFWNEEPDLYGK